MAAREASDFKRFEPALERVLDLQSPLYRLLRRPGGRFAHPYDVLLDDYEAGLTTAELQALFSRLQGELVPLVSAAAAAGAGGRVFEGHFPVEDQKRFIDYRLAARRGLRERALASEISVDSPVRPQHGARPTSA